MKEIKALMLDRSDITRDDKSLPLMYRLSDEAFDACAYAHIVVFNGHVVKNRFGSITEEARAV